jgi:lipopolysaccharide transport system permease protein
MTKLIIEAGQTEKHYWADLWRFRELLYVLAWRDINVRYKQTVAGVGWAVLQPMLTMAILTLLFGKLARMPADGFVPYPLMVFAGMLPWLFFSGSLSGAGQSVVANANLISKIYFPRLIVPVCAVATALVDLLIAFGLLALLMLWYGFAPSWHAVTLPAWLLLAFLASLGPGLLITALNVKYRDFRFLVPFIVQFGLYVSPVGFSSAVIPEKWRLIYSLNPMVGVIDGFRWALLGGRGGLYLPGLGLSVAITLLLLVAGVRYFRRTERMFADMI